MLTTVLITILATLAAVVIISNLTSEEWRIQHRVDHLYAPGEEQFERTMGSLLAPGFVPGNRITCLENGAAYFPEMLEAMRQARHHINLETFIFWSGEMGERFADVLIERAGAGVETRVMIDWVGSFKASRKLINRMRRGGVQVARFRPPRIVGLTRFNNRTHRKILVIDGRIGYTGGAGIADAWKGRAHNEEHWRDSQYRVEGPVVAQLQAAFMDNWLQTRAQVLHGQEYFPPLEEVGTMKAQVFISGPEEGIEGARVMFLLSIASAARRLLLGHSYFIPDNLTRQALVEAKKRGVEVEIVVPGPLDTYLVRRAMISRLGPLLKAGIKVYEYREAMYHRKFMLVDHCWVSVGSANFDTRSFRLNDEICLNVLDDGFAGHMAEQFENDKRHCREITLEQWHKRPLGQKLVDWLCAALRSQL